MIGRQIIAGTLGLLCCFVVNANQSVTPFNFYVGAGAGWESLSVDHSDQFEAQVLPALSPGLVKARFSYTNNFAQFFPYGQIGFMLPIIWDTPWVAGSKFYYQYANVKSNPGGGFNSDPSIPMTQLTTSIGQQFAMVVTMGRTFLNSLIYVGAGPGWLSMTLSQNMPSVPQADFSQEMWLWTGSFQFGVMYFLEDVWFLDFNYNYSFSESKQFNHIFNYTQHGAITETHKDQLIDSAKLSSQSMVVSINRRFSA